SDYNPMVNWRLDEAPGHESSNCMVRTHQAPPLPTPQNMQNHPLRLCVFRHVNLSPIEILNHTGQEEDSA
ncbi:hypothetical protein ACH5RR_039839, partial [Cinchona calisaya]